MADENQDIVRRAKSKPCADCRIVWPYFEMDLDHLDGKSFNLSRAAKRSERAVRDEVIAAISTTQQVDRQQKLNVNGMEFVSIDRPQWLFVRPSKAH